MNINVSDKLVYLGIGAALGLLFAPRSGREFRHDLSGKVDALASKVQGKVQESGIGEAAGRTFRNVVDQGRNIASIGRRRINESIAAGKRKFHESMGGEDLASR